MRVEKILGITGFKSIPVVYYSLNGHDFQDHKRNCQRVVFFYLDLKMKVEINWLSELMRYNNAHLQQGSSKPQTIADIDRS